MTCHITKKSTAAQILPLIPKGKMLKEVNPALEAKLVKTQANLERFIKAYVEVRDMTLKDKDEFYLKDEDVYPWRYK